jgi:hypothetical protein
MSIKNISSNLAYLIILFITIFMFFSFKGCTKDSKNPIIEDETDPTEVFFKNSKPEEIITIETSTGGELDVIGNNILISVDVGNIERDEIKIIIEETGGELVGQFPAIGLFQAEYQFSTGTELMSMIETLNNYSEVEFATYNAIGSFLETQHSKDYCNKNYDNHQLDVDYNRFFEDIEYYLAVPLMGLVREHMTLSTTKVLVIDTGVEVNITKEFNDVNFTQIHSIDAPDKFWYSHGTRVAGVIAADNKDGGVNGITSSLIGDRLELISAALDTIATQQSTVVMVMDLLYRALESEHPQICNMSIGWGGLDENGQEKNVEDINENWKKFIQHYPNVLFVISGGNKYYEMTNLNYAPGGIQLPNIITTASTAYGYPQVPAAWSAYGPLIDIAGPGENCPTVKPTQANAVRFSSGNSFSAPAVASLAAVLKSIKPSLSPGEIKSYILNNSSSTAPSISGRRLVLPQPIEQLLIDMGAPTEILQKVDMTEPIGEWDTPGVVAARICNASTITIGGEPIMQCETSDTSNIGYISEIAGGGVIVFSKGTQLLTIGFWNTYKILNLPLDIVLYFPGIEGSVATVSYSNTDLNHFAAGNAFSDKLSLKNGRIIERYPGTGHPMVIEAEGTMSGTMEMVVAPASIETNDVAFSGAMVITIVLWEGESEAFYEYFEDNCD